MNGNSNCNNSSIHPSSRSPRLIQTSISSPKISIIYFSGVGATKMVAELMHSRLSQNCEVDIFSVESKNTLHIDNYDALIVGTPTYHAAPAKIIMNYFDKIPRFIKDVPAFVYNTYSLYSLNTNRILAKQLQKKNIHTIMDKTYRSPASDGSIIAPFVKRFFEFEKDLEIKIDHNCMEFLEMLKQDNPRGYIPRFQFGSIINAPNKAAGQLITLRIHLHKDKCVKCNHCIEHCPHAAISTGKDDYPLFISKNCENCYRCIHHCTKVALSLSKRRTPKKLLRY